MTPKAVSQDTRKRKREEDELKQQLRAALEESKQQKEEIARLRAAAQPQPAPPPTGAGTRWAGPNAFGKTPDGRRAAARALVLVLCTPLMLHGTTLSIPEAGLLTDWVVDVATMGASPVIPAMPLMAQAAAKLSNDLLAAGRISYCDPSPLYALNFPTSILCLWESWKPITDIYVVRNAGEVNARYYDSARCLACPPPPVQATADSPSLGQVTSGRKPWLHAYMATATRLSVSGAAAALSLAEMAGGITNHLVSNVAPGFKVDPDVAGSCKGIERPTDAFNAETVTAYFFPLFVAVYLADPRRKIVVMKGKLIRSLIMGPTGWAAKQRAKLVEIGEAAHIYITGQSRALANANGQTAAYWAFFPATAAAAAYVQLWIFAQQAHSLSRLHTTQPAALAHRHRPLLTPCR